MVASFGTNTFECALVITHFMARKNPPYDPIEGPANSVCKVLEKTFGHVGFLQLPLAGFDQPLTHGHFDNQKKTKIPTLFGKIAPIKYLIDMGLVFYCIAHYSFVNRRKKKLVIGVDPLSCLPLVFFKKFFGYKLVFYSVDFNKQRFSSPVLQKLYELANRISSQGSDQVWVVSESLKDYQETVYQIQARHISNAPIFNDELFREHEHQRAGNKLGWSGSFMTDRQFDIFFTVLRNLQGIRPDLTIHLVPISDHEKFEEYAQKYRLEHCSILRMYSRLEWQQFVASCDVGVAIYDDQFGQTQFAEPLKMWDYMMCGVPFIISKEPSIPSVVKESGVAYILDAHNGIPTDGSLEEFLRPENLKRFQSRCVELAEQFSIDTQIASTLKDVK